MNLRAPIDSPAAEPDRPTMPASAGAPSGFIRPRSAHLSIRWIATLAVAALTTGAVLSVGTVAERNTRSALTREIETRLLLQARNLSLTSTEALLTEFPELSLHPVVKEMKAKQPELALVLVLDHAGVIQGDPDARQLGSSFHRAARMHRVPATQPLGKGEALLSDGDVLVASAPVLSRDGRTIGTSMVGLRRGYLEGMIESARRQQTLVLGIVLLVGLAGSFLLMSFLLRPIETLRAGIERIGRGDLGTPLQLRDRTELGVLAAAVNDMAAEIKKAQAEMVERERLAHEVELARQIQTSLLPNRRAVAGSFVVEGSQRAAAEVGGDFYDYFELPGGRMGVAVADVSGKGLAGCLVMSMLSALLRAYRSTHSSPASLLVVLDEHLGSTLQQGSFVTMFYGVLDPRTGDLTYASAGHSPLLVYRKASQSVEWFPTKGIPLGAIRGGRIRSTLKDYTLRLDPGDVLVQFTDGVNEAFNPAGQQFGFEQMGRIVTDTAPKGCSAVIAGLHRRVEEWTGDGPPIDDETVLVASREGMAGAIGVVGSERDEREEPKPALSARPRAGALSTGSATASAAASEAEALALLARARLEGHALRLPADLDALVGIRKWLAERLSAQRLVESDFELLSTAIYEACSNIVEHGCAQDASQEFELWWVDGSGLGAGEPGPPPTEATAGHPGAGPEATFRNGYFLIRDHGKPFRADNWRETDFSDPKVWRRGRGFGLDIIHRVMSHVSYHPGTPDGNITLMTFLPDAAGEEREELRHA